MTTMQIYASELSKFEYKGKSETVLVAGEGIVGIELQETAELDPKALVGAKTSAPVPIEAGSEWTFRDERAVVPSERGGLFAFLVPVL